MSHQSRAKTRYDRTIGSVRRIFSHRPSVSKRKISDYSYTPLEDHHIRLLELRPGTRGTVIHIDLIPMELSPQARPSYHALSYAWGSPTLDHEVLVESGESSSRILRVTQNLYVALQHLRYGSMPRRLWVDAICINQQDTDERSRQVERMADIYGSAEKVVIWLGPEKHGSSRAIEALDQLASRIKFDRISWKFSAANPQDADTDWLDFTKPAPFDDDTYQSIGLLFKRAWFYRLWVWQEVHLAEDAEISCGDSAMAWTSFTKALLCLHGRVAPPVPQDLPMALWVIWPLCTMRGRYELRSAFVKTRLAQCSDPRDRVYAILNLVSEHERYGVKPDYNKSVREVHHDLMVRNCSVKGTRSFLPHCELNYGTQAIPSWVPDWSVPKRCNDIFGSKACGQSSPQARLSGNGNNVLNMVGVPFTHVTGRFEILPGAWPSPAQGGQLPNVWAVHEVLKSLVIAVQDALLLPRDQQAELICRILFLNRFSERWEPENHKFPQFHATVTRFLELTDTALEVPDDLIANLSRLLAKFYSNSFGRAFIITANKEIVGLAPDTCRKNDCIAVLLGCESPMVLRPTDDGHYTVVGECYVHGLMESEALLGPLPAHWERIFRYDEGTERDYDVFVDRRRGIYQPEDPRFGPLPEGWYREEHPKQHLYTWFRHPTREDDVFTSDNDPRMLPESLRERGVELQEFALI